MNRPLSFAPETFETESTSLSLFALSRVIPDDPDYRKYVPLNYRLNAKEIVGEVAEDLRSGFGWETSILSGGARDWSFRRSGGLVSGGSGKDRGRRSATGFSRGAVMGAERRQAKLVKGVFWIRVRPGISRFPSRPRHRHRQLQRRSLNFQVVGRVRSADRHGFD
jgi:hypothetical protein